MKKYFSMLLVCLLCIATVLPVYAEEDATDEWFEMIEEDFEVSTDDSELIQPYTAYLVDVGTSIQKLSSNKVGIYVNVYCSESVKTITTTFYLQKVYNGVWKNVSSGVVSASNTNRLSRGATVSGLTSGKYRAKTVTKVTDKYGYSETMTVYTGAVTIS